MLYPTLLFVLVSLSLASDNEIRTRTRNNDAFDVEIVNNYASTVYFSCKDRLDSVGGLKRIHFSESTAVNSFPLLFFITSDGIDGFSGRHAKMFRLLYADLKGRKIMIAADGTITLHSNEAENSIEAIYGENNLYDHQQLTALIGKHRNSLVAAYLVYDRLCNTGTPADSLSKYYGMLSSDTKESFLGTKIKQFIQKRQDFRKGAVVKDFQLKDSSGNQRSIYAIKSKFILLDFWFSRCGPCIESFPALIKLYNSTGRDKLEVVGITIDAERDLELWKQTMLKHKLPWINLIDPKYSISYHTFSIDVYPTKVLIDNNTHQIVKINPTSTEILNVLNQ